MRSTGDRVPYHVMDAIWDFGGSAARAAPAAGRTIRNRKHDARAAAAHAPRMSRCERPRPGALETLLISPPRTRRDSDRNGVRGPWGHRCESRLVWTLA